MTQRLDLLIVFPNNRLRSYGNLATDVAAITPPVQAGLTAAYVREKGHAVSLLDADADNLGPAETARAIQSSNPRFAMVCTDHVNSGDVTKMAAASDLLKALRAQGSTVPIMLEGVVPTAYPEQMLVDEGADFVCAGEAFVPIIQFLEHIKAHGAARLEDNQIAGLWARYGDHIVRSVRAPMYRKVDEWPMTAWDLIQPSRYRAHIWHCFDDLSKRTPYACIATNYGCPYGCTFCSVNVVAGGSNFRARSPERVLDEIDYLVREHGVRTIRILDNVFTIRLEIVEQICDMIIDRGYDLNMWAYARVESIKNIDILHKMKRAGVNWLAYGIEAASERVRIAVDKGSNERIIHQALHWTQEAGINIVGNFIFGLPEDDMETMQMSFDMAKEYNFEWANFYCAMAYPGTALHKQALADGIHLPDTWSGYGQYSPDAWPMATKYVKPHEILRFRDEAFREYYSQPRYLKMIERKFGSEVVACIKQICEIRIHRNYPSEVAV